MDVRIRTEIEAAQLALLQAGHETQELLDALHSIAAAGRAAAQWHHVDRMRGAIAQIVLVSERHRDRLHSLGAELFVAAGAVIPVPPAGEHRRGLLRRIWDWLCAPHRRARAAMPST